MGFSTTTQVMLNLFFSHQKFPSSYPKTKLAPYVIADQMIASSRELLQPPLINHFERLSKGANASLKQLLSSGEQNKNIFQMAAQQLQPLDAESNTCMSNYKKGRENLKNALHKVETAIHQSCQALKDKKNATDIKTQFKPLKNELALQIQETKKNLGAISTLYEKLSNAYAELIKSVKNAGIQVESEVTPQKKCLKL